MPKAPVPAKYHDILESTTLAHFATMSPAGQPQVNPVWFIWDGERVLLSVKVETIKYRNMVTNPAVAMSFSDPANPSRYLEVRGEVIELELFDNLTWVNELARKYTGADFGSGVDGEHRYKVTIRIDFWTGQG